MLEMSILLFIYLTIQKFGVSKVFVFLKKLILLFSIVALYLSKQLILQKMVTL